MRLPGRSFAAWTASGFVLMLGASLALARVHPFGNAELFAATRGQAVELSASIPTGARAVLAADCVDCHSSVARAPAYGRFAPVSWLLERDIVEARTHLNFSEWDSYGAEKRQQLLAEIAQQAKAGHMPPAQYVLAHRDARLKAGDVAAILDWVHALNVADSAPGQMANEPVLAGDATRGADLFNRRCTGCHSLAQSREGPRLAGVYGRAAASVPDFPYSAALKGAQLTWNEKTLEKWLTDPDAFVPGVNMDFRVPKAQERADLIAFLKQGAK